MFCLLYDLFISRLYFCLDDKVIKFKTSIPLKHWGFIYVYAHFILGSQ